MGWEGEAWGLHGNGGCRLKEIWAGVSLVAAPRHWVRGKVRLGIFWVELVGTRKGA